MGDVCAPKKNIIRAKSNFKPSDEIQYIDISSIDNMQFKIVDYTPYIFSDAPSRAQQVVQAGDIVISLVRPNLKNIALVNEDRNDLVASSGFCVLRSETINKGYLFHFIKSDTFTNYLLTRVSGANYPAVREEDIKDYRLPVPSMEEQEAIVAELDEINEAIAAMQQQVADLDTLAQSTFYDMFGDPEKNPFGYDTLRLDELCLLKAGKAIKANQLSETSDGRYPCFGGNGIRGYIEVFSHDGIYPIIGRQGALCGNINLARGQFYATEHAVVVSPLKDLVSLWLFYALKQMHLEQYAHGVAQPGLSVKDLNPLPLYYPPLALQQEFAAKVEAMESAKAEINAQISDLQTLLASRMDYYFD